MTVPILLKGVGAIRQVDKFLLPALDGREDPFLQSWRRRGDNPSLTNLVNRINPEVKGNKGYYEIPKNVSNALNFFETVNPEAGTGFMYDAVMAVELGACAKQKQER